MLIAVCAASTDSASAEAPSVISYQGKLTNSFGAASPGYTLFVNGSAAKPGGGSWTDSSDQRLKKNIQPLTGALENLLALRGVTYEWMNPEEHGNFTGSQIGMMAQDVEKVFPQWVGTDDRGFKTLTFRGFEALTVEALRKQQKTIDDQRQLIANQQKVIDELRARNADIDEIKAELAGLKANMSRNAVPDLVHTPISGCVRPLNTVRTRTFDCVH